MALPNDPRANRFPLTVLLASLLACATAPPVPMTEMPVQPPAQAGDFVATGELLYSGPGGGRSAAYNQWRIVGRAVNMSYIGNNVWAGDLNGKNTMLSASPGKLVGAGVSLNLLAEGDGVTLRGQWFQRAVNITITPKQLKGRTGAWPVGSYELPRARPNVYSAGSMRVELRGEALQFPNVSVPQFYLALLAVLGPSASL